MQYLALIIWFKKFLAGLGVMKIEQSLITLFCNNIGAVTQSKEPRNRRGKDSINKEFGRPIH
jgi:hypothetical protein